MPATPIHEIADEIGGQCLAVRARMLARVVTSSFDQALRPFGVSVGQVNHLVVLARMSPVSSLGVARALAIEPSTVSRNLERMRLRGWVESDPGSDPRTHEWKLTPAGRSLLRRLHPIWKEAQRSVEDRLGEPLVLALSSIVPGRDL